MTHNRVLRGVCVALLLASCALASCNEPGTAESVDITATCLPPHNSHSSLFFFSLESSQLPPGTTPTLFYAKRFQSPLSTAVQTAAKWNITFPVNVAATPSSPLTVTVAFVAMAGAERRQLGSQQFQVAAAGAQCLVWEDFSFAAAAAEQYFVTFQMSGCDGTALTLFADAAAASDSLTLDVATGTITQLPHALDAAFAPAIDGWACDIAQYADDAQCCVFGEGEAATHTVCSKDFYCCQPLAQCVETENLCTATSSSTHSSSSNISPSSSPSSSSNISPDPSSSSDPSSSRSSSSSSNISPDPSSSSSSSSDPSSSSSTSPDPSSSASSTPSSSSTSSSSASPASPSEEESSSSSDTWPDRWLAGVTAAAVAVGVALVFFIIAGICACHSKPKKGSVNDMYEDDDISY